MAVTLHCAPVVLPITAAPIRDGAVLVDGRRIAAVGTAADLVAAHPDARERRWPGVLMPGLVNAHTHLQFTAYADLMPLGEQGFLTWIRALTARRQETTDRAWAESARRGVHALFAGGTTCAADVVTDHAALAPVAHSGLAGVSYVEIAGVDAAGWHAVERESYLARLDSAPAGRAIGVAPHSLYTVAADVIRDLVAEATARGLRVHVHVAETADEDTFVRDGGGVIGETLAAMRLAVTGGIGTSPVAALDQLGVLAPTTHVAHGVHCDAVDRKLLRARRTAVALCVRSNAILGAGEPPVADYLAEDSPIAIGTDSLASSPDLDLLAESHALHALALRQGASADGLSERVIQAATVGGADALGCDDAGRLEVGAPADLAAFDVPTDGDPYTALVMHGAGRCVATVLGGRLVHRR